MSSNKDFLPSSSPISSICAIEIEAILFLFMMNCYKSSFQECITIIVLKIEPTRNQLACVASVSVGLSAGFKHFSLLERAKIGASAKNSPPPPRCYYQCCVRPQLLRRQNVKNASNGRKTLRKRLLRRLGTSHHIVYFSYKTKRHSASPGRVVLGLPSPSPRVCTDGRSDVR